MVPTVLNSYVTQQDSGRSELYFEVLTCHIFATSIKHIFQYTIYIYIPFIDFSHGNSENPPVFFDVSPIESSQKWWISQLAMLTASLFAVLQAFTDLFPVSGDSLSATFREIHWVSLSDFCSKRVAFERCAEGIFHEPTIWANLSRQVKVIFERLLEWLFLHTFLHMLCSMEWVYVGSIGLLEKVPSIIPKVAARSQEWNSCWTSCKSCRKMRASGNLDSRCEICWGSGTATWFTRVSRE